MYSTNIDILKYENYRQYLCDVVSELKSSIPEFSYRKFSSAAGFKSPNFLLLLIQGERNISTDSAKKIAKAFSLDKIKESFFINLVKFNQALNSDEKVSIAEKILDIKKSISISTLNEGQFEYFSNYINIIIREILVKQPGLDIQQICTIIIPQQSERKIQESIQVLLELKLVKNINGKLFATVENIRTGDSFQSASVFSFHKQMIEQGKESLDLFNRDERNVSSVTVALSKANYDKAIEKINNLRNEIMLMSDENDFLYKIYQFNFQLFPLTKNLSKESI